MQSNIKRGDEREEERDLGGVQVRVLQATYDASNGEGEGGVGVRVGVGQGKRWVELASNIVKLFHFRAEKAEAMFALFASFSSILMSVTPIPSSNSRRLPFSNC